MEDIKNPFLGREKGFFYFPAINCLVGEGYLFINFLKGGRSYGADTQWSQ
jgi:hypothetical protein